MGTQKGLNINFSECNWKIPSLGGGLLTPAAFQPVIVKSKYTWCFVFQTWCNEFVFIQSLDDPT